jgi:hypothetical protein
MPGQPSDPAVIYQLMVTLRDSDPLVWRRVQVASDTTLLRLHDTLQAVMGWLDYHLHAFQVGEVEYMRADPDFGFDRGQRSENRVHLYQIASGQGAHFTYLYDFGDEWEHDVVVEDVLEPEPGRKYPVCVSGGGARPPEDVGGIWGYRTEFLPAVLNPKDPEHENWLTWAGGHFDPNEFDLDAANNRLSRIQRLPKPARTT